MTTLSIVIERGDNSMATSFLIWGAYRRFPTTDGDGVFVGEVDIAPDETETSVDWDTPNGSENWKFIVAPKFNEIVGIFGQLEAL